MLSSQKLKEQRKYSYFLRDCDANRKPCGGIKKDYFTPSQVTTNYHLHFCYNEDMEMHF